MTEYLFRPIDLALFVLGVMAITSFVVWLLCRRTPPTLRKPVIIVVDASKFGPRMDWPSFQNVLRHQANTPMFRAMAQMLLAQREICQGAVVDKSNLPSGQTAYEAGAAGCAADLLSLLDELERGKCSDQKLREWFGEPAKV